MTDFEPFDDELATALRNRAPTLGMSGLDTTAAHDAVLARAGGIRRRRAGIAGGATLAAIIVGGVLLLNGNADDRLAPATEPSTSLTSETSAWPSTSAVPSPTGPTTPVREALPNVPSTSPPPVTTVEETVQSTVSASTVTAQPPASVGAPSLPTDPPAASSASSSSTTLAPQGPASFTKTYTSSGGSIRVTWSGSDLALVSVDPAAEHTAEIEDDSATRIRVRFRGPAESRIEIRYEDGQLTERID